MCGAKTNVRFGSKADMCSAKGYVRFTPESDAECVHFECPHELSFYIAKLEWVSGNAVFGFENV
jgi:hypothetical protein